MAQEFLKFKGRAKKKTTISQNKKTAQEAMMEIAREQGWED